VSKLTERPAFAELMQDEDFRDEQTFMMEAIAKALLEAPDSVNSFDQIEALAQYIALAMDAAEKAGVNKIEVLDRVFEVISYHHKILFHRQGEP
jgi:hypothetical protein